MRHKVPATQLPADGTLHSKRQVALTCPPVHDTGVTEGDGWKHRLLMLLGRLDGLG
jgi:hypothetical protein